jgi:outer membrane protein assembly factor BamB/ABC-type phosphate/phosphonate transport system substrate-binding protein
MVRRNLTFAGVALALAASISFAAGQGDGESDPAPLAAVAGPPSWRMLVMDPLCDRIACDCVAGYARRDYEKLAGFLSERLHCRIEVVYAEGFSSASAAAQQKIDLIAGKLSEVVADATKAGLRVRTVAMLTGKDGSVTQTGLLVVRQDDPARSVEDLNKHRILFGPQDAMEKHSAAVATLEAFRVPVPGNPSIKTSCSAAALAVAEKDADAAIVSSYAMRLLEGCGTIDKGALRVVGKTDPVPFIGLLATDRIDRQEEQRLVAALSEVGTQPTLLASLESRDGFIRVAPLGQGGDGPVVTWPDWRGPRRDALSNDVPATLPAERRLLWSRTLTGPGMSGLAVDSGRVVVADKDLDEKTDIFRCLDADTGQEIWRLAYPAAGKMDFTNSPRANPVIHQGMVYTLGAFGDLHCLNLDSGRIVWKKHLADDFKAERPNWGWTSTPLIVDDKLIVNPGAKDTSLVALDRRTGAVLWSAPGDPPGYASFIVAELGGWRQIVGYDAVSLGGWDPNFSKRLWRLVPKEPGDFNVPTPVAVDGKLLVSTENNGTRLYGFDDQGRILTEPLAVNEDFTPDTSTPVVCDGRVFGSSGQLVCLDLRNGLKLQWKSDEEPFSDYCTFIAGSGHVLVITQSGKLCLLRASGDSIEIRSRIDLFPDVAQSERDVWSHPALIGNRLYVRNMVAVYCFLLE